MVDNEKKNSIAVTPKVPKFCIALKFEECFVIESFARNKKFRM